jgi:hypothetical protein
MRPQVGFSIATLVPDLNARPAEAFHAFNRPNLGVPQLLAFAGERDNEARLPVLGQIRSTVTSARQIPFGLRLSF